MCLNVPNPECCSCGNCLIPLSWTSPDLLHQSRDVVGAIKAWPPKARASFLLCQFPSHVPKIQKSKPSLMWKRKNRKRKAIHFLTHNFLCSLQEKDRSSDYVIIPRNELRSRECTVRLWLWPPSCRKCSPKKLLMGTARSDNRSIFIPELLCQPRTESHQLIDGI